MKKPEIVVITGASAGVGRAAVQAFARRGAHIGLLARGKDGLEGARRDAERLGGKGLVLPTDVSDAEQVERAASAVEDKLGPIDIWVNNAMVSVFSPVKEMTPADYRRVTEVTYLGFIHGTLSALRRMLPRDRGIIVQVGSALAYRGIPLQSAYCGAKHAIQGFTESLRCELLYDKSNVKVTMLQMPGMNTPQFDWVKNRLPKKPQPVPPVYQPDVAAEAIYHAAHHYRREWYVGGSTATVVVGNKMAPALGDWYLGKTGIDSQQTDEPADPNAPNNLYDPLPGDHGAHGRFDRIAHDFSFQLWADQHRGLLAVGGLLGLVGGLLLWKRGSRASRGDGMVPGGAQTSGHMERHERIPMATKP